MAFLRRLGLIRLLALLVLRTDVVKILIIMTWPRAHICPLFDNLVIAGHLLFVMFVSVPHWLVKDGLIHLCRFYVCHYVKLC